MAIINGTELKLFASDNAGAGTTNLVAFAQNCSLSIEHSPREITNKESAGFSQSLEGLRSWSIEVDGMYCWTNAPESPIANIANGADTLVEDNVLNTRQQFFVRFGGPTTGSGKEISYYGNVYITSWSVTGGTEDSSSYTMSLTGTGVINQIIAS